MKSMALIVLLALQIAAPQFNRAVNDTIDDVHFLDTADLNNDDIQEILFWNSKNELICYQCTDFESPCWTAQLPAPVITGAAEDLDGDGKAEIFVLLEIGKTTVYQYRLIYISSDGSTMWRKLIETKIEIPDDIKFHFINMDGKDGKEIVIAGRILLQRGFERMTFEWDRFVVETALIENMAYFLVYVPADSVYELYRFEPEMHAFTEDTKLWQGHMCTVNTPLEDIACEMFYTSKLCSCKEDRTVSPPSHILQSVRAWTDLTGDGIEEAVYWDNTTLQLIEKNNILWTWESPDPIEQVRLMDIAEDDRPEIVVLTAAKGIHVPSCYILDFTGTVYSYDLNLSDNQSVVHFADLDGDADTDILTVNPSWIETGVTVYSNSKVSGILDQLDAGTSLKQVDPTSMSTAFWRFYNQYKILILIAIILVGGIIIFINRKKISLSQKSEK